MFMHVVIKSIREEMMSGLKSGNSCYHSVRNRFCFRLLHKNVKIQIYKPVIVPLVLYECKSWSFTLKEEHNRYFLRTGC
jgi:hypothetical protein